MTSEDLLNELAQQLRALISPNFDNLTVVPDDDDDEEDGWPIFVIYPTRQVTQDEVMSVCKEMAAVIRQMIPESHDGWSASILVEPWSGTERSVFFLGWAGRADHWQSAIA